VLLGLAAVNLTLYPAGKPTAPATFLSDRRI